MGLLARVRSRLSYATVVSAISAFIVLFGGAALAANQLAKNSVGKKQLKANAVTTAKIKKNAVTAAKIKAGAVDGSEGQRRLAGIGGPQPQRDARPAHRPQDRRRRTRRGRLTARTAPAGRPDLHAGRRRGRLLLRHGDDRLPPRPAKRPRNVTAALLVDATDPATLEKELGNVVAIGETGDDVGGAITKTVRLGPFEFPNVRFRPDTPTSHTLAVAVSGSCKSGSGITASNAAVDVIGVR